MNAVLFYLLQVTISSGILYSYYHFFLRNKKFHQYNRYYLLASVILSISIPFLNIPVYFTKEEIEPSVLLQALTSSSSVGHENEVTNPIINTTQSWLSWNSAALLFYILVASIILIRLLLALIKIYRLAAQHTAEKMNSIRFINTEHPDTPFSFFRWLFWNKKIPLDSDNGRQVLRHELYHIRQKHTWDVIFLETVRMIFWINPFFHIICKEIKVIHEFLADKFAANKNEEWNYAELLLMQLLGSPNHRLVNPFFHNQIKRRIVMITSSKKTSYQYLRKLLVLPVAALVTTLFAFKYKTSEAKHYFEKSITVVIDAGHGNGSGSIATDGTRESVITLALAKKVKALNQNERINILLTRESEQDVDLRRRGEIANSNKADMFISIHTNYDKSADKSGFEVFVTRKENHYSENRILGNIFLNYFMNIYKTHNEIKQRQEGIWVIDQGDYPSILVECGYLSNQNDLAYVKNPANQEVIAKNILQSIEQFAIQRELPDFDEKKKQVSDTIKPEIKIFREVGGKVTGTLNNKKITGLIISNTENYTGFMFADSSMTIMNNIEKELKAKYQSLWDEFVEIYKVKIEQDQLPVLSKDADGKITGTYYGSKITALLSDNNEVTGFVFSDGTASAVNKEVVKKTKAKYGFLWTEFVSAFNATAKTNQNTPPDIIFEKVEVEAMFPGGEGGWAKYIDRNLNKNTASENKAPNGNYTVWIQFVVNKDGTVSKVKPLTNHGFGMEKEVIKLVSKGPKWVPAMQNGKHVAAYRKQRFDFTVPKEKNEKS